MKTFCLIVILFLSIGISHGETKKINRNTQVALVRTQGEVFLLRKFKNHRMSSKRTELSWSDQIFTKEGTAYLECGKHTIVLLPHTRLGLFIDLNATISQHPSGISLKSGRLKVSGPSESPSAFWVKTPTLLVELTGTKLFIEHQQDTTRCALQEGQALVRRLEGQKGLTGRVLDLPANHVVRAKLNMAYQGPFFVGEDRLIAISKSLEPNQEQWNFLFEEIDGMLAFDQRVMQANDRMEREDEKRRSETIIQALSEDIEFIFTRPVLPPPSQ